MNAAWVGGTKTPPYSIHAEKALLGACLAHPRIVPRVGAIVPDGEAFFRTQHGQIYDAILETERAGQEPGSSSWSPLTRP